jgi:NAD(P)-dependent dehydrogenase (short-subunit alcohol dehydrogenase family)
MMSDTPAGPDDRLEPDAKRTDRSFRCPYRHSRASGRKAIITGGTTGIGRAIAVLLASEGVKVFVCGRDPQHLEGRSRAHPRSRRGRWASTVDLAETRRGRGASSRRRTPISAASTSRSINAAIPAEGLTAMSAEELRYQIATDFTAYLTTAHAAAEA